MPPTNPLMYTTLADWFEVLTPPAHYTEEAQWLQQHLEGASSLLELGSGGGHLAAHLKVETIVLSDLSPQMLEASKRLHPTREHHQGDMRALRLGRTFDAVLIHDAIMYLLTPAALLEAMLTAHAHLEPGGLLIIQPDFVMEGFEPRTEHGGSEHPDGRALRYLEWDLYDPATPNLVHTHYSILCKDPNGKVHHHHDQHQVGVFPTQIWLELLGQAGFDARHQTDPWGREVFFATRRY